MDVKDFVKSTISQIADAIRELNADNESNIRVNICSLKNASSTGAVSSYYETVLDFKLALTVNDKSGSSASVGILTGFFGGGVKGDTAIENAAVSTVSFKIPVMFPQG